MFGPTILPGTACGYRVETPIGRTTIAVLDINHPDAVAVRTALHEEGVF